MPTIIMKEAPGVDYYIGWSSIVEAPVWGGDRSAALTMPDVTPERILRADLTGTSSLAMTYANLLHRFPETGSWADGGEIYQQQGTVRDRASMFVLARRILDDEDASVDDLLEAFDDD